MIYKGFIRKSGPLLLFLLFAGFSASAQARKISQQQVARPDALIVLGQDQIRNVYSIAYNPQGTYIAAGYNNDLIRIWSASSGRLIKTLSGHKGIVWSVAFSPDGKTLISGAADKTLKFWDVESGRLTRSLNAHDDTVSFVTFSADGNYAASGSADRTIKFWDRTNGRLLQTLKGHTKTIASISYSRDGKYMASASWDKTVRLYYALGGMEIMTLAGHTDAVFAVAFSPDGKLLASGSSDRTIRIWDRETGQTIRVIGGYRDAVWAVVFSPDGKHIAGSAADGSVRIWNAETGALEKDLIGHASPVRSVSYHENGKHLASGASDGIVKLWNAENGDCLASMVQNDEGEWATWTPEGYFTGSDWALKNASFRIGGKEYGLSQLSDKLLRPDIVSAKISDGNVPRPAAKTDLASIIRTGDMPDVNFSLTRRSDAARDVDVSISATDAGAGIGRVVLKLNERSFLVADSVPSKPGQTKSLGYSVTLREGENTISVSAYDAAGAQESARVTKKISWTGKTEKPRLFLLCAAIDKYAAPGIQKLNFCVSDADSIVDTFRRYSGDIYSEVSYQRIVDEEVTKKGLLEAFTEMAKEIRADDVFVFYIAGHGVTHTDGDYYFIPYDYRVDGKAPFPEAGVSKWDFVKYLSKIRASQMLVLLDTCNSGSFIGEKQSPYSMANLDRTAIIDRFAAKSGYDTLAACGTYQYALESYNGHGIFTYHIMEALQGYADLNNDGRVTSTELSYYVITEVPANSYKKWGYKQEPQRVLPNLDYVLAGKENPRTAKSLKTKRTEEPVDKPIPGKKDPTPSIGAIVVTAKTPAAITVDGRLIGSIALNETGRIENIPIGSRVIEAVYSDGQKEGKIIEIGASSPAQVDFEYALGASDGTIAQTGPKKFYSELIGSVWSGAGSQLVFGLDYKFALWNRPSGFRYGFWGGLIYVPSEPAEDEYDDDDEAQVIPSAGFSIWTAQSPSGIGFGFNIGYLPSIDIAIKERLRLRFSFIPVDPVVICLGAGIAL